MFSRRYGSLPEIRLTLPVGDLWKFYFNPHDNNLRSRETERVPVPSKYGSRQGKMRVPEGVGLARGNQRLLLLSRLSFHKIQGHLLTLLELNLVSGGLNVLSVVRIQRTSLIRPILLGSSLPSNFYSHPHLTTSRVTSLRITHRSPRRCMPSGLGRPLPPGPYRDHQESPVQENLRLASMEVSTPNNSNNSVYQTDILWQASKGRLYNSRIIHGPWQNSGLLWFLPCVREVSTPRLSSLPVLLFIYYRVIPFTSLSILFTKDPRISCLLQWLVTFPEFILLKVNIETFHVLFNGSSYPFYGVLFLCTHLRIH